ncbi:MAG: hypothetical protein H7Z75_10725 [Ferruginibacter sp.]|nr:hypothetical protein [Cytophagales bacterium]
MSAALLNITVHDGSRQFSELPQTASWYELRAHLKELDGVEITEFLTDHVTEAWMDFSYRGNQFSVNNQFGDYWFFVQDPSCSEEVLLAVFNHCKSLLGKGE